jgi:hypothetical protein
MSLEKQWQHINEQGDDDLATLMNNPQLNKLTSQQPLQKIKNNLLINMAWGIAIAICYILILIFFPFWQVRLCIGIVFLFTLWAVGTAYTQYKSIQPFVSSQNSLLAEMKRHHASMMQWMKTQQSVALFIYPISTAGGFMLGGVEGSGKSVEFFMSKPIVQISLVICIAVLVPLAYWLAKWLFNKSFGKHLKTLGENIEELSREEQ